ncbi:MAG: exo-alpha-sialidase [Clostridia bacterium]|nr:exo-alpha-sialidase [Clostridia bacterium]
MVTLQHEFEELARTLLAKPNRRNIVMEVFDHFSIDCIKSQDLDSQKLDALIEEFNSSNEDVELLAKIIVTVQASVKKDEKEEQHLAARISQYLDTRYSETKTIYQIAEELNISYYYLSHFVKIHFGVPITALRNKVRICKAKIALVETDKSVSDIASHCGFDSISYFTEVFTSLAGMSPRAYRTQYADKIYFDFYNDDDIKFANSISAIRLTKSITEKSVNAEIHAVSMPDEEYKFLHEAAIIEYRGKLYASWYNCREKELHGHTPIRGKRSSDGGVTWSDIEVIDEQVNDGDSILYCPPVYGICDGKLYMFVSEMVAPDRIHALNLYVLDEETDFFVKIRSLPVPFKLNTNVVTLEGGKLMLPGRIGKLDAFPNTPAVLISDSGKIEDDWRLVKIAENGDMPCDTAYRHPEISAFASGKTVYMFCRFDARKVPIVYISKDNGETWSKPYAHDIPFSDSKMYAGTLKDGRHYVVGNIRRRGRHPRALLALYVTEKGSERFSEKVLLTNGENPDFECSYAWHYPCVTEQNGQLKVICTVSFKDKTRGAVMIDVDINEL